MQINILSALALNGAHHRPLLTFRGLDSEHCFWASGDVASYKHRDDATASLAEVGACHDFIPSRLRVGLGGGKSFVRQNLAFSGSSDMDGNYVLAELDYRFETTPLALSVLGMFGRWDADIKRGTLIRATPVFSAGSSDVETLSARIRLDWLDALQIGPVSVTPRVALTLRRTTVDGYVETGGLLPAQFDGSRDTSQELRYGFDVKKRLTNRTGLRAMVEGIHLLTELGPSLSGQVLGLFSFNLPGRKLKQDWLRVGVEIEQQATSALSIAASVNGSTAGHDPVVSGGLTLIYQF